MKVKCISAGNFKHLTINKEYVVLEETADRYIIDNDNDVRASYAKKYFEVIAETASGMGAAPVKKAKIKPKTVIGIGQFVDRCEDRNAINPDDVDVIEAPNSCGVCFVNGLNGIFDECEDVASDASEFIDGATEELNVEVRHRAIVRETLRRMFRLLSNRRYTFFMFTTNDAYPEAVEVFKLMCNEVGAIVTEDRESLSSRNEIFVAIIDNEQIARLAE